ncbi:MAG TPA: hypothetical protein VFQ42_19200 [Mycobacterium sp.]|nr:hypothetical protein [Mycobacterium sp.]
MEDLRSQCWLGISIGLSITLAVFMTIQAITDAFRPNIITNALLIATAMSWQTCRDRFKKAAHNRVTNDRNPLAVVRGIRSKESSQ